jgi:small-conductance mechanosensitive channel
VGSDRGFEPLKMPGVDAFGDFAVQIRIKMMTLPGENFVIRRKALAMIKMAFDTNGIKFRDADGANCRRRRTLHRRERRCRTPRIRIDQIRGGVGAVYPG